MKKLIAVIMLIITIMTMTGCSVKEKSQEDNSGEVKVYYHVVKVDRSDDSDLDYVTIMHVDSNGKIKESHLESKRIINMDLVESEDGDYANLFVYCTSKD